MVLQRLHNRHPARSRRRDLRRSSHCVKPRTFTASCQKAATIRRSQGTSHPPIGSGRRAAGPRKSPPSRAAPSDRGLTRVLAKAPDAVPTPPARPHGSAATPTLPRRGWRCDRSTYNRNRCRRRRWLPERRPWVDRSPHFRPRHARRRAATTPQTLSIATSGSCRAAADASRYRSGRNRNVRSTE